MIIQVLWNVLTLSHFNWNWSYWLRPRQHICRVYLNYFKKRTGNVQKNGLFFFNYQEVSKKHFWAFHYGLSSSITALIWPNGYYDDDLVYLEYILNSYNEC